MEREKPSKIYLRGSNGFKAKTIFKEELGTYHEWAYNLVSDSGVIIYIPPHFFESAYRRVKKLEQKTTISAKYFNRNEIDALENFVKKIEQKNRGKIYGTRTLQLILDISDATIKQRKTMLRKLSSLSESRKKSMQQNSLKVLLENRGIMKNHQRYLNLLTSQKLKFSSRINRYPFIFSLIENNPNKILLNTVYLMGDSYPRHTIIVYGI